MIKSIYYRYKEIKMRFRERLIRFMAGRYGGDRLNNFLLAVIMIIIVINVFVRSIIISIVYMLLWGWSIFRMMSRNIYKRQAENAKFLKLWNPVKGYFKLMKNKWRDRKTHVYKKCPKCKAVLRLPKQKGNHTVKCPKCGNRFDIVI